MTLSIENRVALVTGGARGIGAGIVRALVNAGASVMVADIGISAGQDAEQNPTQANEWRYDFATSQDLTQALEQLDDPDSGKTRVRAVHLDVTDKASCQEAVAATVAAFGQLDVLVNNAGVVDSGPVGAFDAEAWDRIFAVNTKGIFLMTQAALGHLKASSQACIVNTASIAGKKGYPNMSAYCGSKFAAIGITQSLAAELAADDIRVNAICPGMVGTAMWLDHLLPTNATTTEQREAEFEASMTQTIPLGRPQTADDMGEAVHYLVTAANVSGISLAVAGGFEMN